MASQSGQPGASSDAVEVSPPRLGAALLTLAGGALLGAGGLAWWLLTRAERQRRDRRFQALIFSSRLQDGSEAGEAAGRRGERELQERVEELNAAIEAVRRQLENLTPRR
jgi:hypothetical protein